MTPTEYQKEEALITLKLDPMENLDRCTLNTLKCTSQVVLYTSMHSEVLDKKVE